MRALAPQRDIRLWPERLGDPADIAYACAWQAPRGLFAGLPRLKAIFSLGAGVDHLLARSASCPTCRSCASSIPISPCA